MKYTIITDSSCNLFERDFKSDKIDFQVAPLTMTVGDKDYIDTQDLDVRAFVDAVNASKTCPKSACPSPAMFKQLMEAGDNVIVVSISSKLSGTYASAKVAESEIKAQYPNKNVFVLDSLSAAVGNDFIVLKLRDLIENNNFTFEEVCEKLTDIAKKTRVRFLLHNLDNLVKNGRMNKMVGNILNAAKIKIICGDDGAGEIKKYGMSLGFKRGLASLAEFPKHDGREVDDPIMIAHVFNDEDAQFLKSHIEKHGFKNVMLWKTRGLSSLYASDKGIILAY